MATTTNYSWSTPDDTALVKDGAAAIRSLGTAIDTTVFNNAGAGIAKTIVDAKGDIIAATAADTVSRLAVGANDTVLTADSTAATGLKWATVAGGGMTLLSTTTLSGASTTVSSISAAYENLYVEIEGAIWNTATSRVQLELTGTGAVAFRVAGVGNSLVTNNGTVTLSVNNNSQDWSRTGGDNFINFTIFNYASTNTYKGFSLNCVYQDDGGSNIQHTNFFGGLSNDGAINALLVKCGGNTMTAGTIKIYGVK
jgi:hypothetical protein